MVGIVIRGSVVEVGRVVVNSIVTAVAVVVGIQTIVVIVHALLGQQVALKLGIGWVVEVITIYIRVIVCSVSNQAVAANLS